MTPLDPRSAEWEQSARRTAAWTTGLLVLFVLLVAATIAFGYVQAQKALEPDRVADEVEHYIESHKSEWREDVKKELARKAPAEANRAVKQAEESLPRARERVERYLDRELKAGLDRAAAAGEQEFRKFVQENRDYVRQGFAELHKAATQGPQFAAGLEERLDKRFGVNLRQEAAVVLEVLGQLDAKLERLARDKGLSPSEQVERRIVRTLRALQHEGTKEAARIKGAALTPLPVRASGPGNTAGIRD
jgi:hypothetical protein